MQGLAGQTLVAKVLGVGHVKALGLTGLGAAQILSKVLDRVFAANIHQHVVHLDRLAALTGARALKGHAGKVSIGQAAVFVHVFVSGAALAQAVQGLLHLVLVHRQRLGRNLDLLVALHAELRQHLKGGAELQRLALFKLQVQHLRLPDRHQVLLLRLFAEGRRQQMLDHFGLDLLLELAAHNRGRHLALAEARDAGVLLEALERRLPFGADNVGGDLDRDLTFAGVLGYFGGCFRGRQISGCQRDSLHCHLRR